MDVDGAVVGNDDLERELAIYVLCGRELEECGDRNNICGRIKKMYCGEGRDGGRGGAENGNGDYMQ